MDSVPLLGERGVPEWGQRSLLAKEEPPHQAGQGTIDLSPLSKLLLRRPGPRPACRQLPLSTLFHALELHQRTSSQPPLGDGGGEAAEGSADGRVGWELCHSRTLGWALRLYVDTVI